MKRWIRTWAMIFGMAGLAALQTPSLQANDNDRSPLSVTVSFGGGLNTASPPGNPLNHHVLPKVIDVGEGGVVNFVVAGFHQIIVYNSGVRRSDLVVPDFSPGPPPVNLFINDLTDTYYVGINPGNANPVTPAAPATLANLQNRVESVSFQEPGLYLVICNVNPHYRDGMWAWVRVSNDHDHHDH